MNLLRTFLFVVLTCATISPLFGQSLPADPLLHGFKNPPDSAKLWAYWCWLNGNVTPEAISRDLAGLKEKGFGGVVILDASGASQDGNAEVPVGPMFGSPAWRKLFRHTLHEAANLGLSVTLNIQSGWNLGGPFVKPEHAAKHITFSETTVHGPATITPRQPSAHGPAKFYRDIAVLAVPRKNTNENSDFLRATASSANANYPEKLALDGSPETYWVSAGNSPQTPVSPKSPQHFTLVFNKPVSADKLRLAGRPGYGPKDCELAILSDDGNTWENIASFSCPAREPLEINFARVSAKQFRLKINSSFDPSHPNSPRNVQIAEIALFDGKTLRTKHSQSRSPLRDFNVKIAVREFGGSAPDCLPLLRDEPETPGEEDAAVTDVRVLKEISTGDGKSAWEVPAGDWTILRFGYTQSGSRVSTASGKWQGYTLDYLNKEALQAYWKQSVQPLLDDAGPLAGKTLRYLFTDSWECEGMNWTKDFIEEFTKRRGYDPLPYLPIVAGKLLDNRKLSNRFLNDFRRTIADCVRDNHYAFLQDMAAKYNIGINPESGGPHGGPFDSLQLLGLNDIPTSEFWSWSPRHRIGDISRFFIKQPASAAHLTGKSIVAAEGFTNIGMHWQESFSDNLKPAFDQALCEGLNLLIWQGVTCSPDEMGMPGQEFFAGTHFNPQNFTFTKSQDFLKYINRSQFILQQGNFVADVLEYYGENSPNFTQMKGSNTAKSLPDYNYDTAPEEALLTRVSVKDGKIYLPDGTNYKVLVLPERDSISAAVLRKLEKWVVEDGLTVIGPKPVRITGLSGGEEADVAVQKIAARLWGEKKETEKRSASAKIRSVGKGRVASGISAKELLNKDKLPPDFERLSGTNQEPRIDTIHRVIYNNQVSAINLKSFNEFSPKAVLVTPAEEASGVGAHVYFVANLAAKPDAAECAFRVTSLQPELWDALTGERRLCKAFRQEAGRTIVPIDLAAFGSVFVVFRGKIPGTQRGPAVTNTPELLFTFSPAGAWEVSFAPKWGGAEKVVFEELVSWDKHTDPRVRFYSGPAVYRKTLTLPTDFFPSTANVANATTDKRDRYILRFGGVAEIAEVRLNGRVLGTVWARPYEMDVTAALRAGENVLEIEVVNHWANRVIGDASLPPAQRLTRTNIRRLTAKVPLTKSGLIGPVELLRRRD